MTASPEEHAAVEQLLAERDALHGWLTRLDAASVAAPDAVRERVRRDYQERLEQLTHALREHGETLGARLREDRREHADLAAQATIAREALAEVELRHEVGEFTHERYEADRRRHTSDLETYELSLAAVEERIRRLEEVQAQVNRAPQAPAMEPTLEPEAPELLAEETVGESQDAAAEPAAEDEAAGVIDMDELAPDIDAERVLSIFTEVDEIVEVGADDAVEMEPSDPEAAAAPAPPATATPDFGPLSFRPPSGAPAEAPPPSAPPPALTPRFVRPAEPVVREIEETAPSVPPIKAAMQALFSEEIVAAGPTPEPVASATSQVGRTLRCGECGAMNRPNEWYCEKCGAELSAL